jgi:hypothetical protein
MESKNNDELENEIAFAAFELYGEPTIEDSEDKRLPNGQQNYILPDGWVSKKHKRQERLYDRWRFVEYGE